MRQITELSEFKVIQLDILKYVHNFCLQNNIKYSLGYGTLIGAVRHQGFIPWDDDIDIIMRRSEYDRFVELFAKETGRYRVLSHTLQKNYPFAYAKVTDDYTIKIEEINNDITRGLDIDVFPVDDLPEDENLIKNQFKRLRYLHGILSLKQVKLTAARPFYKNVILFVGRLLFSWYSIPKLINAISDNAQLFNGCQGKKCAQVVANIYGEKEIRLRANSDVYTELSFEGCRYPVIQGYDEYLRLIYGDYMALPPVDKQVSHHGFVAFWKE